MAHRPLDDLAWQCPTCGDTLQLRALQADLTWRRTTNRPTWAEEHGTHAEHFTRIRIPTTSSS